ncbi:MAG: hypothetical protein K6F32_07580 [Bacilli bacterium]|nr:hypothetical protein [Bacilli bacterium]
MFVGRVAELNALREFYGAKGFGLAFVYGRRRIGKSALLRESLRGIKDAKPIYWQAERVDEKMNTSSFLSAVSQATGQSYGAYPRFIDALKAVLERNKDGRIVIAIDEYPYLKRYIKGLDSSMQALIDGNGESSQAKIVLCGSYLSSMRDSEGQNNGPLRGRSKLSINLRPLTYLEAREMVPEATIEEAFQIYALFGGIPYYISLYNPRKSFKNNVTSLILSDLGTLRNEPSIVLEELSDGTSANLVLQNIATGAHDFRRIHQKAGLNSTAATSYVLSRLADMSLVRKEKMIGTNDFRYYLADPFLIFYYRFIFLRQSEIFLYGEDAYFEEAIKPIWQKDVLPHRYEDLCAEYLALASRYGQGIRFVELGKATFRHDGENGEFDIVGKSKDGIAVYECKYEKSPLSLEQVTHLEKQVEKSGLSTYVLGYFAKDAFEADALKAIKEKGYAHFLLSDIYSLKAR